MFKRYQFVWWGFTAMAFGRGESLEFSSLRHIYEWCFCCGPIEIRKWKR